MFFLRENIKNRFMLTCKKCLLNENYPNLTFNKDGVCCKCENNQSFTPLNEEIFLKKLAKAKKKNSKYNALVPLSGGKDSTYILYLATKVYNLKVLTYTYDNGFFSRIALDNIKTAVEICGADHFFYKPQIHIQKQAYRTMFKKTGDLCGTCDIGTKNSWLKISQKHKIPLILLGISPLENDSFIPDNIQDVKRFNYIMRNFSELSKEDIKNYTIYPKINYIRQFFLTRFGVFGKEISPLFFMENPSDHEMGEIIKKEMGWKDVNISEFTKHFDCIAEPLTNYVRNNIYGYERRICQLSNMIRSGEISRNEAIDIYKKDNIAERPENTSEILDLIGISEDEFQEILKIKPMQFEKQTDKMNSLFAKGKAIKDKLAR